MTRTLNNRFDVAPGVVLWPEALARDEQQALVAEVFARAEIAPFYRPVMPKSGKPFSVEETNFGSLGWVSDVSVTATTKSTRRREARGRPFRICSSNSGES